MRVLYNDVSHDSNEIPLLLKNDLEYNLKLDKLLDYLKSNVNIISKKSGRVLKDLPFKKRFSIRETVKDQTIYRVLS